MKKRKKIINIITAYFDKDGCYDEDIQPINDVSDHLTLYEILHLPDCSENEYYKIFIEYADHSVKEVKVEDPREQLDEETNNEKPERK